MGATAVSEVELPPGRSPAGDQRRAHANSVPFTASGGTTTTTVDRFCWVGRTEAMAEGVSSAGPTSTTIVVIADSWVVVPDPMAAFAVELAGLACST